MESTEIEDQEVDNIVGKMLGVLPGTRRFEMLLPSGEIIQGAVLAQVAERYLELIEGPDQGIVGRWWRVRMKIREVRERNKPPRKLYSVVGLIEPSKALSAP